MNKLEHLDNILENFLEYLHQKLELERNKDDNFVRGAITGVKISRNRIKDELKCSEKINEQDRRNANEYHYDNYKNILNALNNNDEAEAKAIIVREMNIIDEDSFIENDEEGKNIELADAENQN